MIKEFRVLAVSKETQQYDTDMIRGVFAVEHPMLDAVDSLPTNATNAAITILTQYGWKPTVKKVVNTPTHILIPFVNE